MRISKPPEERKQEIIDTAMSIFAKKGYEATTITDISKQMNVVSGLIYKYFKSKEELYHVALDQYARQFSDPIITSLNQQYSSIEEMQSQVFNHLFMERPNQQYHAFFHGKGNEIFHQQLNYMISIQIVPHVTRLLTAMLDNGQLHCNDAESLAQFIVFGITPILDNEDLSLEQKSKIISELFEKVIC